MFRDFAILIGLAFIGFVMGVHFQITSPDCAKQRLTPTTSAGAATHEYRHTPYAVP